jgi:ABC-type antimicrobial peptide transport system permease subunit
MVVTQEEAPELLLGGLIGVGISALVIPLLATQVGSELFQGVNLSFQPLAGLAVFVVVIVVSAGLGLFPALQAGRMKPIEASREI